MKKLFCIFFAAALAAMACGCQPTPEKDSVVNKANFEKTIKESTEAPTDVEEFVKDLPAHLTESSIKSNVTVSVDADVVCEVDYSSIPVYKFRPYIFTHEKFQEWVRYFAGDNKFYSWPTVYTKSYYEQEIIRAKQGTEVDGELVVNEEWIRHLEELYKEAPEGNERHYIECKIVNSDPGMYYEKNEFSAAVETNDADFVIYVQNSVENNGSYTRFYCEKGMGVITENIRSIDENDDFNHYDSSEYREEFEKTKITRQQAEPAAEKIMSDLNIENMVLVKSDRAFLTSFENQYGISSNRENIHGIELTYMRSNGGILPNVNMPEILNSVSSGKDYIPSIRTEKLRIFVGNDGVVENFIYDGILEEDSVLSEGVTLEDFDRIVERGIDYLYYRSAFVGGGKAQKDIKIDSVSLVMTYANAKDDLSSILLVPAWKFSGKLYYTENGVTTEQDITATINAVDGSRA